MPQMSPYSWMFILMLSTTIILQMNSTLYYNQTKKKFLNIKKNKKKTYWKW